MEQEKILVLPAEGREKRAGEEVGPGGEEGTWWEWVSLEKTQSAGYRAWWRSWRPHVLPAPIRRWVIRDPGY